MGGGSAVADGGGGAAKFKKVLVGPMNPNDVIQILKKAICLDRLNIS